MRVGDYIIRQSKLLLENKQQAIFFAIVFSVLPFISWLSVSLVVLITLRKGAKCGFEVMLPALIVHSVPLMMLLPLEDVLINALIAYVPCFLAALTLRRTNSWQITFGVFLIQAMLGFLLIQCCAPDFISNQLNQLKGILSQYQAYQELINSNSEQLGSIILAYLFFGFQLLGIVVSSVISLMFARSIQAKLYVPGGFANEILKFRSGKLSFLVLAAVSLASYYEVPFSVSMLPLLLAYFLISGFNLAFFILARKRQVRVAVLLILLILLKPTFVIFAYIVFGSLDSLINIRLYLPAAARESI